MGHYYLIQQKRLIIPHNYDLHNETEYVLTLYQFKIIAKPS